MLLAQVCPLSGRTGHRTGPHLEASSRKVGDVVGAQAFRWYIITISGCHCDTGSPTFPARSDTVLYVHSFASNAAAKTHDGLASTGIRSSLPGSTNTVQGKLVTNLDIFQRLDRGGLAIDPEQAGRIAHEGSERGRTDDWRPDASRQGIHPMPHGIVQWPS